MLSFSMVSYFLNFFKVKILKPSFKFFQNIFFLIHMSSINFIHTLHQHIFINSKNLKIKLFRVLNNKDVMTYIIYWILLGIMLYVFV